MRNEQIPVCGKVHMEEMVKGDEHSYKCHTAGYGGTEIYTCLPAGPTIHKKYKNHKKYPIFQYKQIISDMFQYEM